jgi:hypothetical protein
MPLRKLNAASKEIVQVSLIGSSSLRKFWIGACLPGQDRVETVKIVREKQGVDSRRLVGGMYVVVQPENVGWVILVLQRLKPLVPGWSVGQSNPVS